jgi:hypothetical protein
MAYFPNGTAGEMYQEKYCNRCLNNDNCMVWTLHLLHNGDDTWKEALDAFIPEKGIGYLECTMFRKVSNDPA